MTLEFVTLTTGHVVHHERSNTPDRIVQRVRSLIHSADGALVRGWSVKVHETTPEKARFDLLADGIELSHCWLCLSEAVAEQVWQDAINSRLPIILAKERPSNVPWLAVGMALGIIEIVQNHPARLLEAAKIELCTAWALMDPSSSQ